MLGQKVKTLINQNQEAGYYSVEWDGRNDFGNPVSSGIYLYRIKAGNFISVHKMTLLR
jgi:flagellar hook assembly protein FlgD